MKLLQSIDLVVETNLHLIMYMQQLPAITVDARTAEFDENMTDFARDVWIYLIVVTVKDTYHHAASTSLIYVK